MNILLIGNGFDLAHGLPTKYTDFLEWTRKYYSFYSYATRKRTASYQKTQEEILQYFNDLFYNENKKDRCAEIYHLLNDNIWIEYFLQCDSFQKENWIDFESEISQVIQSLDDITLAVKNSNNMWSFSIISCIIDIWKKSASRQYRQRHGK